MALGRKTGGRKPGSVNKAILQRRRLLEALDADDKEIINRVVQAAKAGDPAATATYFRYLRPAAPKLSATPVEVPKPQTIEDVRTANADLFVRVLGGEQDLNAAAVASGLLKSQETSIVGVDLAELLEKFKALAKGKP